MSKHAAAATDPRNLSPKVKSAGVWGAVITAALVVAAAFLQSIPREALEQLGPWAAPVGAAVATLAAVLAAYAKADPAREPSLLLDSSGGVYTSADDVEAERFIRGEYASNRVEPVVPQERPVVSEDVDPEGEIDLAAQSEAAAEVLHRQLLDQFDPERDA